MGVGVHIEVAGFFALENTNNVSAAALDGPFVLIAIAINNSPNRGRVVTNNPAIRDNLNDIIGLGDVGAADRSEEHQEGGYESCRHKCLFDKIQGCVSSLLMQANLWAFGPAC